MRMTLSADSATPAEVYDLTLAYQRTRGIPLPAQLTVRHGEDPTPSVTVGGTAMGWTSPYLDPLHAVALLLEFHSGGSRKLVTQSAYEVALLDHVRGNCHDSTVCALCAAERAHHETLMRQNRE